MIQLYQLIFLLYLQQQNQSTNATKRPTQRFSTTNIIISTHPNINSEYISLSNIGSSCGAIDCVLIKNYGSNNGWHEFRASSEMGGIEYCQSQYKYYISNRKVVRVI